MNKTIIININGIVFHIEEDAYEILKSYMTDVKRHFSNSADSLEITTDIENRIAEMFSETLIAQNKQVIVEQDVNTVVEQMGTVADFEFAENDEKAAAGSYTLNNSEGRRLFRDPDDHLIAGVCSGVANYFDIDSVWVRLLFAITTTFAGTGFILYIILWIVVPKAVTRADRMAMKGEKQNLKGFKKNFEEELNSVRNHLSNFGDEARPFVYKARDFVGDFFHHLGIFLGGTGRVLLKLIGIFILMCCLSLTIFIIVGLVGIMAFGRFAPQPFSDLPLNLLRHNHGDYIYISAFLLAFIPLLTIVMLTLRGIFNTGSISKSTGSTFLVIWLCALGVFTFYTVKTVSNISTSARFSETFNIKKTKNNTYYLKLDDQRYFSAEDSARLDIKSLSPNMKITEDPNEYNDYDHYRNRRVHINIERSDVDQPVLIETFRAQGRDDYDALRNARNIRYMFTQIDTVLKFDYRAYPIKNDLWHEEEVDVTLKVPMNSTIVVEHKLGNILENANLYDCNVTNKREDNADATFTMTSTGLQCRIDTLVTAKPDTTKAIIKPDSAMAPKK